MANFVFTESAAKRIARAVRRVERTELGNHQPHRWANTAVTMPFKNGTTETIPAWAVMAITGTTALGTTGYPNYEPILTVSKPSTTFTRIYAVNTGVAIASSGYGACYVAPTPAPVTVCIDTTSCTVGAGYGPKAGQWSLSKNYPVTSICLGLVSGSTKTMLGTLGPIERAYGKTAASHAKNASGTITLYSGSTGAETTMSMGVSAYNHYVALSSGKSVEIGWPNGDAKLVAGDCST